MLRPRPDMRFASGIRNHSGLVGEHPPIVCSRGLVVIILVIFFREAYAPPFTNRVNSRFTPLLGTQRPYFWQGFKAVLGLSGSC